MFTPSACPVRQWGYGLPFPMPGDVLSANVVWMQDCRGEEMQETQERKQKHIRSTSHIDGKIRGQAPEEDNPSRDG